MLFLLAYRLFNFLNFTFLVLGFFHWLFFHGSLLLFLRLRGKFHVYLDLLDDHVLRRYRGHWYLNLNWFLRYRY